ncbi:DUF3667 domain-containing protein [Flavobacterium ginsenosidimutans]|uniref:DUF3667 domain-containing protein n=1 Tax=Flavobacterium ginsenosidimutans TaxID=687844 RepID=UPI000DAE7F62|nr:DUF3667 domain-containing protein [Flavobacterium ginsenosidimutans]KAF2326593.1 DUF3667 domain-containing protein [Flavobacterium ginsenosidimutans]
MTSNCLNCNEEIAGKFCSNCSQAASTHRFSLSHVIKHDFIHGIFHFDKGFFYTIKELFSRPGHSIREYVQGKRTKHFNYFATIILLLTISYFLQKWGKIEVASLFNQTASSGLFKILKNYSKFTVFLHIPIIAFASYLFFRKSKQNYTENLVLNLYLQCGVLTISLIFPIFMLFTENKEFLLAVNVFLSVLTFFYLIIFNYQYFSVFDIKKYKLIIRVVVIAILFLVTKQLINNFLNFVGLKYLH